jgi:hypothetical protein
MELFECPISKLNQASLPIWEYLRPKEIMEWELLTEHLKDRELNQGDPIGDTDLSLWNTLLEIAPNDQ